MQPAEAVGQVARRHQAMEPAMNIGLTVPCLRGSQNQTPLEGRFFYLFMGKQLRPELIFYPHDFTKGSMNKSASGKSGFHTRTPKHTNSFRKTIQTEWVFPVQTSHISGRRMDRARFPLGGLDRWRGGVLHLPRKNQEFSCRNHQSKPPNKVS